MGGGREGHARIPELLFEDLFDLAERIDFDLLWPPKAFSPALPCPLRGRIKLRFLHPGHTTQTCMRATVLLQLILCYLPIYPPIVMKPLTVLAHSTTYCVV